MYSRLNSVHILTQDCTHNFTEAYSVQWTDTKTKLFASLNYTYISLIIYIIGKYCTHTLLYCIRVYNTLQYVSTESTLHSSRWECLISHGNSYWSHFLCHTTHIHSVLHKFEYLTVSSTLHVWFLCPLSAKI